MLTRLLELDAWLRATLTTIHAPPVDHAAWVLSVVGQAGGVWLVLGLVVASCAPRRVGQFWQLCLAILVAYLVVDHVLKPFFARARPFDAFFDVRVYGGHPSTFSFPSGHAANSFAGAFVLSLMVVRLRWALWALAVAIAASRVYLGVHYPLDVLAGALVGVGVGVLVTGGRAWYSERSAGEHASTPGPRVASP